MLEFYLNTNIHLRKYFILIVKIWLTYKVKKWLKKIKKKIFKKIDKLWKDSNT